MFTVRSCLTLTVWSLRTVILRSFATVMDWSCPPSFLLPTFTVWPLTTVICWLLPMVSVWSTFTSVVRLFSTSVSMFFCAWIYTCSLPVASSNRSSLKPLPLYVFDRMVICVFVPGSFPGERLNSWYVLPVIIGWSGSPFRKSTITS
ncbi:Uncharacterised protein [Enterobacter hormaechei]|nr:Uncharacterised protein [Enterobacter hormaechei]